MDGGMQVEAERSLRCRPPSRRRPPRRKARAERPQAPDPRLPAPGTLIQKRDRHGEIRGESTVEAEGIRSAGKSYTALSAAAMAAGKDLGLTNKTQKGFVLWGLSKPPRQPSDPLVAIERAWERYHGNVEALVKEGVTERPGSRVLRCPRINRASGRKEREGPGCNPGPHKYRPAEGAYARSLADPEAVVQFLSIRAAGWTPSFSTS
jgi:hypothetical protein